ncbi:MAG: BACON domain-containing carbohydrate-binding protein [Rikenellaceae bacterium]
MILNKFYPLVLCFFALLFVSCEESSSEEISDSITISTSNSKASFDSNTNSKTITFTSTSSWKTSISETTNSSSSWISVSPSSGVAGEIEMTISVTANTETTERSAEILIYSSGAEGTVTVTQSALTPTLTLSKSSETIPCSESSLSISVTSNYSWEANTTASWVTLSPNSGTGDGTISLSCEANTTVNSRSATINVSSSTINQQFTLTQEAFTPTLSIDKNNIDIPIELGSFEVNVTSNTDWKTSDVPEWITLSSESGNGTAVVTVSYTENETSDPRSAIIKFYNDYSLEQELTITQDYTKSPQLGDLEQGTI